MNMCIVSHMTHSHVCLQTYYIIYVTCYIGSHSWEMNQLNKTCYSLRPELAVKRSKELCSVLDPGLGGPLRTERVAHTGLDVLRHLHRHGTWKTILYKIPLGDVISQGMVGIHSTQGNRETHSYNFPNKIL